jgi:SAM-dependent methyltransferase
VPDDQDRVWAGSMPQAYERWLAPTVFRPCVPLATWRQADALRLPFADQQFDLVVCQFGVMFFPDRPAAFREMRRVLAPAGRLLFSTWGAIETHGFAAALMAGLGQVFPDDPPAFLVAVPHG